MRKNRLVRVPEAIKKLQKTLEYLDIANNRIEHLPEELFELKLLKCLHIYNNEFTEIPTSFSNLNALQHFSLEWFTYCLPKLNFM